MALQLSTLTSNKVTTCGTDTETAHAFDFGTINIDGKYGSGTEFKGDCSGQGIDGQSDDLYLW